MTEMRVMSVTNESTGSRGFWQRLTRRERCARCGKTRGKAETFCPSNMPHYFTRDSWVAGVVRRAG